MNDRKKENTSKVVLDDLILYIPEVLEVQKVEEGLQIRCEGNTLSLRTPNKYELPIRIDLTAKTNDTNIKLYYGLSEIVFNWECSQDELIVQDLTGSRYSYPQKGYVSIDEYVDITWIIHTSYMKILVNNKEILHNENYPYIFALKNNLSKKISEHIRIGSAMGSTITVKSLNITNI